MAATAPARTTAPKRSAQTRPARHAQTRPARRTAPKRQPRRRQITPPAGFVPVAVGAVGGLADSGLVHRLTRGRLWIGILAVLLVGIVALNVMALSFSASSSEAGRQADELKRLNSAAGAQIAQLTASAEIQQTATRLGLYVPSPNEIGYLEPSEKDAVTAARRLRSGELSTSSYVPPVAPIDSASVPAATTPETTTTAEPTADMTVTAAPAEEAATTEAPVAPVVPVAAATGVTGGGLSSP
jgi:hypothetical protein